ncbi:hypothetical protein SLA2020_508120 [Shorea laevis]
MHSETEMLREKSKTNLGFTSRKATSAVRCLGGILAQTLSKLKKKTAENPPKKVLRKEGLVWWIVRSWLRSQFPSLCLSRSQEQCLPG